VDFDAFAINELLSAVDCTVKTAGSGPENSMSDSSGSGETAFDCGIYYVRNSQGAFRILGSFPLNLA
jgi:hypothetical protein